MAISKSRGGKRLVLDIGSSAVRLCELSKTKAGLQLTKYYQRDFGIDPSMDEADKQDRRSEVLGALLKEAKIRTKKAIVAVPGQSVFTRNRPLPPVPEYKVTQIVRYEIQQQIPFSLNEIALDYQVLDRTEVGGYDVMMAAIKVDVVEKQLEILSKVKRSVSMVDVSPLAAYNWLCHTGDFGEEGQCIALVDLGATTTDIVIQKDSQFRFTRSLHVGGNDVTAAIASAFNMSHGDAEKLKREKAFAPTGDPQRDGKGGEVTGRILGRLVGEINRSFAYFRSQPGGGPVTRVIITGGGACLKNIIPFLQRQLNVEVRIAQPLAGLAIAPTANEASEHPEQACVALGLALRCIETVPIEINLIPPRVTEASKRKEQLLYWALTFCAILLIMASTIPATAEKIENTKKRISDLTKVLAEYDPALINNPTGRSSYEDEMNALNTEISRYKEEVRKLDAIRRNRHFWIDELHAFNDQRPNGIAVSSIQTIVLGGRANTGELAYQMANSGAGGSEGQRPRRGAGVTASIFGFPGIEASPQRPIEPNGLALTGYGIDVETVLEFERRLKESPAIIEGGVYLHIRQMELVPFETLDSASFGRLNNARSPRSSGGGGGGSSGGGGINIGGFGGGINSQGGRRSAGQAPKGVEIIQFQIEIQFVGNPIPFSQD